MSSPIDRLIEILELTRLDDDRWRGVGSVDDGADGTYGGHLIGQATAAALASSDESRRLHSLHSYFLRAGEPGLPIEYEVTRTREGRSFSARRVSAMQHGKVVFEMIASLTAPETGRAVNVAPPADFNDLPDPESLATYGEIMQGFDPPIFPVDWIARDSGTDLRPINAPWCERGPSPAGGIRHWVKAAAPLANDPALHTAATAYQSDESLADTMLIPFDATWCSPGLMMVSLDHAMWFHRTPDLNDWLLFEQWPGQADNARGLAHGRIWNRTGELIATMAQEALMRMD